MSWLTRPSARRPLAIVGGTLIDGAGSPPIAEATVVIEGGRFTGVGVAATTPVPPGADVIDARGKFLLPGLVDMHVHVLTPERWHPELFLAAGVTTVLDLGGQVEHVAAHRAAVEAGALPGPRLCFTGPMLEEGDLYAGFAGFCRKVDAARIEAEVDSLAAAGVDGIKLYVTVRPETARRACTRAHARGLPVFMHQHATWGAEAAEAGVDSVEHINVFGALAPPEIRPPEPERLTPFEYGGWLWRWLGSSTSWTTCSRSSASPSRPRGNLVPAGDRPPRCLQSRSRARGAAGRQDIHRSIVIYFRPWPSAWWTLTRRPWRQRGPSSARER